MIFLEHKDVTNMLMMLELTVELRHALESVSVRGGKIDDKLADELRDLCTDKLDVCGYDENYNLNENGKILDALVDKLYVK